MTNSPTLKIHYLYCIKKAALLIVFLSSCSCASLNFSTSSFNLEGKISFASKTEANILFVRISEASNVFTINLYEPLTMKAVATFSSLSNQWTGKYVNKEFFNNLPTNQLRNNFKKKCAYTKKCRIERQLDYSDYVVKLSVKSV